MDREIERREIEKQKKIFKPTLDYIERIGYIYEKSPSVFPRPYVGTSKWNLKRPLPIVKPPPERLRECYICEEPVRIKGYVCEKCIEISKFDLI